MKKSFRLEEWCKTADVPVIVPADLQDQFLLPEKSFAHLWIQLVSLKAEWSIGIPGNRVSLQNLQRQFATIALFGNFFGFSK